MFGGTNNSLYKVSEHRNIGQSQITDRLQGQAESELSSVANSTSEVFSSSVIWSNRCLMKINPEGSHRLDPSGQSPGMRQ